MPPEATGNTQRSRTWVGRPQMWQSRSIIPRRWRVTCTAAKLGSPSPGAWRWSSSRSPGKSVDGWTRKACSPDQATDQGTSAPICRPL